MKIPYAAQKIEDDDIATVIDVLRGTTLTTGPYVEAFEGDLCKVVSSNYATAVSNGTAALHIAVLATGLKANDEAIVPAITFAATANAVLYAGALPVFVDIDKDTLLLDFEDVQRKISSNTKAVIPVHYGGETCDMDALSPLAASFGLSIIQDSAHSLGSRIRGKEQGEYLGMQIWSFHPAKTITTGEGGAVTTNDESLYKKLLKLRTHGITRDITQYTEPDQGGWYYEMQELGYNYRLTDFQCALGISQLKKLPSFAKRRAEIVAFYNEAFANLPVKVQASPEWSEPVRHIYTIRLNDKSRRLEVFNKLKSKGIGVNVHYIPVYLLPYYQKLGYQKGLCPVAEDAYERMITIPLYPAMTDDMVEYVVKCVKETVS